jgi:GNAT superfamily N-acetyltransferase
MRTRSWTPTTYCPRDRFGSVTDLRVRPARRSDLSRIVDLVTAMFAELGTPTVPNSWPVAVAAALDARLGRDVAAYVAVDEVDEPVAVAIGLVDHRLPSPRRPTGDIGYVEWLATDAGHRRRGAARRATAELLRWFAAKGIKTVDVHASAAAQMLYADLGFAAPHAAVLRWLAPGDAAVRRCSGEVTEVRSD